jgi:hypothetical protein
VCQLNTGPKNLNFKLRDSTRSDGGDTIRGGEIVGMEGPMIQDAELKRLIMFGYTESLMGLMVCREKSIE